MDFQDFFKEKTNNKCCVCNEPESYEKPIHKPQLNFSEEDICKLNKLYKDYVIVINKIRDLESKYNSLSTSSQNHDHYNMLVLNNLTQKVIDDSHTHDNKKILDTITSVKIQEWDNKSHEHKNNEALDLITEKLITKWSLASNYFTLSGGKLYPNYDLAVSKQEIKVIDNLESKSAIDALSANQGRILSEMNDWEEL